jgi:hypothetical protein
MPKIIPIHVLLFRFIDYIRMQLKEKSKPDWMKKESARQKKKKGQIDLLLVDS